ncbi:MAG: GyrI-like domain-containing protein [Gammaproteobacteria bacterium]|nr:GyrI-like domain-containing protein [Gammaproteobacteria bacterium]
MKTDLTKKFKEYYSAPREPALADFDPGKYLSIEGKGEPSGKEFSAKVETLYPVAYGIKKICKAKNLDFTVAKLEGLWWVANGKDARTTPRTEWNWKLLIRMPDFVNETFFKDACTEVLEKKGLELAKKVKFESLENGKCVHVMHLGPYKDEPETIDRMTAVIEAKGLKKAGLHHEIYLSDPKKTAPSKMKTILRQPVR